MTIPGSSSYSQVLPSHPPNQAERKSYAYLEDLYRPLGTIALFHRDPEVPVDVSRLFANPPV